MVGLTGFGAYVPRRRLVRKAVATANAWIAPGLMGKAKGERAMANWDEDPITMAVEACRDCLGPADDRSHVDALYLASTTLPYADRLNASIVSAALTLEKDMQAVDITNTQRAGTSALTAALDRVKSSSENVLVVAADQRIARAASAQELDYGDGAACLSVGTDNVLANFLGSTSVTDDFVDHFRGTGEKFDYHWEERWVRDEGVMKLIPEAINSVLKKVELSAEQIDHLIVPTTLRNVPQKVAKMTGIKAEAVADTMAMECGETGVAHSLLMLNAVLEKAEPGEKILVSHFGQGCDALLFEATDLIKSFKPVKGLKGWLADRQEETNYLKFLTYRGLIDWEKGMRAEGDNRTALTTLYRNQDLIMGLVGGKCQETGEIQFPRSRISVNPDNHTVDTQEPYKFAERTGNILSWSADFLTYTMDPPSHYGMITFPEGGRMMVDITDVAKGEVKTGMDVRMVFRIKAFDEPRSFRRYFWKAVPIKDPVS